MITYYNIRCEETNELVTDYLLRLKGTDKPQIVGSSDITLIEKAMRQIREYIKLKHGVNKLTGLDNEPGDILKLDINGLKLTVEFMLDERIKSIYTFNLEVDVAKTAEMNDDFIIRCYTNGEWCTKRWSDMRRDNKRISERELEEIKVALCKDGKTEDGLIES